jgi:hypothetical protein
VTNAGRAALGDLVAAVDRVRDTAVGMAGIGISVIRAGDAGDLPGRVSN